MRLLLDTHIWLWSMLDPAELSENIAEALEDEDNELFISPISVWETMILAEKGRIEFESPPEAWITEALRKAPLKEAQLSHAVALKSRLIELPHQDPADRFIAATAWEYDLILVTADKRLREAEQIAVL